MGSRSEDGVARPRAISEHLIERMLAAGATKICFVISPGKSDILAYYAGQIETARICYTVQQHPAGLCDAIFQAAPFVTADEPVIVGLPDTLWFPVDALRTLDDDQLSFLLFPVDRPELFDAVITDGDDNVIEIRVKRSPRVSRWVWGAFKMPAAVLHDLHQLWLSRDPPDEYIGTLINAFIALGGRAKGRKTGQSYVDVGTLNGYREATLLLEARASLPADPAPRPAKLTLSVV